MRRATATLATATALVSGLLLGLAPGAGAASTTAGAAAGTAATAATAPAADRGKKFTMQDPFAREVVRRGDEDTDPKHIEHVHELQYRLKWVGVYKGPVTGYFGDLTRGAVKRFQKKVGLPVNGVATHRTWAELIPRTIKARGLLDPKCTGGTGWHVCYDRYRHQLTLWKAGKLRNAWLVRGGDRGYETRTGDFRVYRRDKDHVSTIYDTPMPYSQFFSGGQALHGSEYMVDPWQDHSHGCVNMYVEDARQLWSMTSTVGLGVHVYGKWDRQAGPGVGARALRIG